MTRYQLKIVLNIIFFQYYTYPQICHSEGISNHYQSGFLRNDKLTLKIILKMTRYKLKIVLNIIVFQYYTYPQICHSVGISNHYQQRFLRNDKLTLKICLKNDQLSTQNSTEYHSLSILYLPTNLSFRRNLKPLLVRIPRNDNLTLKIRNFSTIYLCTNLSFRRNLKPLLVGIPSE